MDRTDDLAGIPVLGEDDVCHILDGRQTAEKTICGAPFNCPTERVNVSIWKGQSLCPDCGWLVCPECGTMSKRKERKT